MMNLLDLLGVTNYNPEENLSQGWALVKEKVIALLAAQENQNKDGVEILSSIKIGQTDKGEKEAKAPLKEEAKCIHKVRGGLIAKSDSIAKSSQEVKNDCETRQPSEASAGVGTPAKIAQTPIE
ncbi:unnamed protein product [Calypogeia fissa]